MKFIKPLVRPIWNNNFYRSNQNVRLLTKAHKTLHKEVLTLKNRKKNKTKKEYKNENRIFISC